MKWLQVILAQYHCVGQFLIVEHCLSSRRPTYHCDPRPPDRLPVDLDQWPIAVGGKDPRIHASPELGQKAIAIQLDRMAGILREALARL